MKRPTFSRLLERGADAHRAGRVEEALAFYRRALGKKPNDAEALSLYGLALLHSGALEAAESPLRKALDREPDQTGFRLNLIEFLDRTGRHEEALRHLSEVLVRQPQLVRAWEKSGDVHTAAGNAGGAVEAYARAASLEPNHFVVAFKLARAHAMAGHPGDAMTALEAARELRPDEPSIKMLELDILASERNWRGVEETASGWLQDAPDDVRPLRALSRAQFEQSRYRQSMASCRQVLEATRASAADLTVYARVCLHALDFEAAASALAEAEAIEPDGVEMLAAKAMLLIYLGRFDEAQDYCRRCLAQNPQYVPAYKIASQLGRGRLSDEQTGVVAQLAEAKSLPLEHRITAAFALAADRDTRDDTAAAFAAYQHANALCLDLGRAEGRTYDAAAAEARTDRLMAVFADAAEARAARGEAPRPIFIVGMPRSGTTLVESVLSAHSRVLGAGERPMMRQILDAYLDAMAAGTPGGTTAELLETCAATYYRELPPAGPADHVTDKHPLNFEAVGLIARLFPSAAIIHVRRNPVETGLSIFRHELDKFATFAHRLEDIGHFYGQHARLMAHWERLLGNRLITVQYEQLAGNFERAARELVETCGLAWQPSCLAFQSADRAIATSSAVQAREPVSVRAGRADRYGERLLPLIEALDAAQVDRVTGARRGAQPATGLGRLKALFKARSARQSSE